MLLKQFFTGKIAHSSYILAGKTSCAVVDPRRDVDVYINEALAMGTAITHILETHLHADFLSGHLELAKKTGARIYAPASASCAFNHVPVSDGERIRLEDMDIAVWETPGHTPEHVTYIVTDRSRGDGPVGAFVGDVLFVGDVGRPDLFPDRSEELADKLYYSLHDKLLSLPDYCEVYPAHGAGSLCGRSLGAKRLTTIGYERAFNPSLQIKDKTAFISSLTTNMPSAPDHFGRCSDINRRGPALLSELPALESLTPPAFRSRMRQSGAAVLDVRGYAAFAALHIPGAWHIDLSGNFPTFAGWVLPPDQDLLLVADDYEEALEAKQWAARTGIDRIGGWLAGGMTDWALAGFETDRLGLLSVEDLHAMLTGHQTFTLVDVRAPQEYAENHIEGAVNIPTADLRTRWAELDRGKPTVVICSAGIRAGLGACILKRQGFREVYNVAGGMAGYSAAGYAGPCTVCVIPHGSRYFSNFIG
ncbi:MAG: MBL fold metallo-hydrolase [Deltaproteobacteria bacterium]|nr:MBL fold metallo-hydrolase [Deltaproteobacteria bacterium]